MKPFSDSFPQARVYSCPGQWSWPVNLPPSFRVDGVLCEGQKRQRRDMKERNCCILPHTPCPTIYFHALFFEGQLQRRCSSVKSFPARFAVLASPSLDLPLSVCVILCTSLSLASLSRSSVSICVGERAPWEDEIECKLFSPPIGGVGPSNEVRSARDFSCDSWRPLSPSVAVVAVVVVVVGGVTRFVARFLCWMVVFWRMSVRVRKPSVSGFGFGS